MNRLFYLICLLTFLGSTTVHGQPVCKNGMHSARVAAKTTVADPAEDNYDVKYVKLNLKLSNTSTYISGDVTTRAVTVVSSFSSYVFELDTTMTIDSVLMNGSTATFGRTGIVTTATLPSALASGTSFTAQVFYHGTPTSASGFFGVTSFSAWSTTGVSSLSESYHAREWWPCKQSLRDKIDSADMWFTVPEGVKAGSNGLLVDTVSAGPGLVRYEWKERYPIDYYLISYAVGNYAEYSYTMHFTSSTDSMLIQNYIYSDPAYLPTVQANLDSVGSLINYFSSLYGRYPFWKEKYGHCANGSTGGMENQTMTSMGSLNSMEIISHELGHQWFGDNVTCGSWGDVIMNEGFATYSSYLYYAQYVGVTAAQSYITGLQGQAKATDTGSCFVYGSDTTNEVRVFDGDMTYAKGACILHMLRSVVNNDASFFQVFKNYQSSLKGGNGTISDLRNTAKTLLGPVVNGISLDTFFNQWAYLQGYPALTVLWNQSGSDVYVQVSQYGTDTVSVPYFTIPLELQLTAPTGDTMVRVNLSQPSQQFHFSWSGAISSMTTDPNNWLVYRLDSLGYDPMLGVCVPVVASVGSTVTVYPNPASDYWHVDGLSAGSLLQLCDATGRVLWRADAAQQTQTFVPADSLPEGVYFLSVYTNGRPATVLKLLRQ